MLNRREMIQTAMVFSAWTGIRPLATTQRITGSGVPMTRSSGPACGRNLSSRLSR